MIGIGAALVGIGLAALALSILLYRRKRDSKPAAKACDNGALDASTEGHQAVELDVQHSSELDSNTRIEMEAVGDNIWEIQ